MVYFYDFGVGYVQRFPHLCEAFPIIAFLLTPVIEGPIDDPTRLVEEAT